MLTNFLLKLGNVINTNGFGNQVIVISPSSPYYANVTALFPPDNTGYPRVYSTIGAAISSFALQPNRGDQLLIAPGTYNEAVVIPRTLQGLTIIGVGSKDSVHIAPTATGAQALTNNADDLNLYSINFVGNSTSGSDGFVNTGSNVNAYDCSFSGATSMNGGAAGTGPGTVANITAGTAGVGDNVNFYDCEFYGANVGLGLFASDHGQATNTRVFNGLFHDLTTSGVYGVAGGFGFDSVGGLVLKNCTFANAKNGTAPTTYLTVNGTTDHGVVTGCSFATATNAASVLAIGTGIKWVANLTVAGLSTAAPS